MLRIFQASFIILNEALTIFIIYNLAQDILNIYKIDNITKLLLFLISFFIVHYILGTVLLFYNNLKGINKESMHFSGDFLLSYFLTASSVFFIFLFYKEVKIFALSFIIADVVSYLIDIKLLVMFMVIGKRSRECSEYYYNFFVILVSAMMIVLMLILNLYIGSVIVNSIYPCSFSSSPSNFDLFYYTAVTFATIGFGDIIPLSYAAKAMAVLISGTSILCLTVFLSSIYSIRSR